MARERIRGSAPAAMEVLHVDNFGNAKIFAKADMIGSPKEGARLTVKFPDGTVIQATYASRMMSAADGTWQIYPGSSFDFLEIGQVRSSGVLNYHVHPGDLVSIEQA